VLCDFDGTISEEDVSDSIFLRFARPPWQELERAWCEGRIGSRDCMAGQVALLDCSREELDAHVDTIAIDPAFAAFATALQREGVPLTIVSDGLDHVIRRMLARAGLAHLPVIASRLVQIGARTWALDFPNARTTCSAASATCKCAWARAAEPEPVLLIGDGASDFCVAGRATLTFARTGLLAHCAESSLPHRAVADFAAALAAWRELRGRGASCLTEPEMEKIDARQ
jgi:2,3-diketo-5-methylthio-1-phosphopentane phosphatase